MTDANNEMPADQPAVYKTALRTQEQDMWDVVYQVDWDGSMEHLRVADIVFRAALEYYDTKYVYLAELFYSVSVCASEIPFSTLTEISSQPDGMIWQVISRASHNILQAAEWAEIDAGKCYKTLGYAPVVLAGDLEASTAFVSSEEQHSHAS